ncbi:MAG: hypothetical protein ISS33_00395 [Candidatus Omnitrophica bacterium]|nr:hypothetical protein [Candidatus Omnitrophota bacterium]
MIYFCGIILVIGLFFQGCSTNTAQEEKKILAHDASFQKLLNKRDSLQNEANQKAELFRKKGKDIDNKIKIMQKEKVRLKKEYLSVEEKIMRQLQPEKRALQKTLRELTYQYKQKADAVRSIDGDINEINTLIKKKESLSLTQEEMRIWNERLAALIEKKETVITEKNKVKKEIEITKLKIKVFR